MEQSITIKIAGKDYPLKATSPEMEQLMSGAESDTTEAHRQEIVNKAMAIQKKLSDKVFKTAEKNIDPQEPFYCILDFRGSHNG